jgi:allantoinase
MCDTGLEEFPGCDDLDLLDGMRAAAGLGLPVLVHAESRAITRGVAARAQAAGRREVRDVVASRPAVAEAQAVARALVLAEEAGCSLHVVHVSTGRAVALVAEARARGVDASCEVCPHHLVLGEEDLERLGALAVCTPPLRGPSDRDALWAGLASGEIASVASDHSPTTPDRKEGDPFGVWGGIAGAQSTLELLLTEGHHARGLPLDRLAEALSAAPARRLRLAGKGVLEPGADADLALVDLAGERTLRRDELLQRHPALSPYLGRRLRARVVRTFLRGRTVVAEGRPVGAPAGRLLRPGDVRQ